MTEVLYKGTARNGTELKKALLLAADVFQENVNDEAVDFKGQMVSPEGELLLENIIVLVSSNGEVCGTCFLVDRFFFKNDELIKGTYLSSICVDESFRGKGLSIILMTEAINECEKRNSVFAVVIARKAVDYYYNKLFFWGVSQYVKINFTISLATYKGPDYQILPATEADIDHLHKIYTGVYSKLYGASSRSSNYWKYILWKTAKQDVQFDCFTLNNQVIGYTLSVGSSIYEIAVLDGAYYLSVLGSLKKKYDLPDIYCIHASEKHPFLGELVNSDFTVSRRQCNYGGHMVRLIHPGELALPGKLTVNGSGYNFEDTCRLLGIDVLSNPGEGKRESFNIPLMDHI